MSYWEAQIRAIRERQQKEVDLDFPRCIECDCMCYVEDEDYFKCSGEVVCKECYELEQSGDYIDRLTLQEGQR
jgi:hypothetical protein